MQTIFNSGNKQRHITNPSTYNNKKVMRTKSLYILIFIVSLSFYSNAQTGINLDNVEIPSKINGRTERFITHKGYRVSYNSDWKIPNWVAYELTDDEVEGEEPRTNKFVPDPMVPKYLTATTDDYKNSGWDRGHMAPAADMKWHPQAMRESFYLSNICPQNHNLNAGVWKDLEEHVRALASQKGHIFVVCGPIVRDASRTIGENKVVVPDAFFKVLLQEDNGEIHTIGFIYENISGRKPMSTYALSVDEVEEITGIDFFPSLPNKIEDATEKTVDFSKWTVKKASANNK
ncbi:MAG: DNA/RNA non-specific endonuclease [Candidatus Limimorpha sp.]